MKLSRKDFIKGSLAGAAALAVTSIPGVAYADRAGILSEEKTYEEGQYSFEIPALYQQSNVPFREKGQKTPKGCVQHAAKSILPAVGLEPLSSRRTEKSKKKRKKHPKPCGLMV